MKKLYVILTIILLLTGCMKTKEAIEIENEFAYINEYYIYGTHLNLNGGFEIPNSITGIKNVSLVITDLSKENSMIYNLNYSVSAQNLTFKLSDLKNNGIFLDGLEINEYIFLLKIDSNVGEQYYRLYNKTNNLETIYYTMSRNEKINQILIEHNHRINSFGLNITENENNKGIYDVIIDAGHGGKDPGACYNGYCETDFTLTFANKLKEKLAEYGITSTLTWDQSAVTKNSSIPTYGEGSRTGSAYEAKAKYLFSFHLNAVEWRGVEIYAAGEIDYSLAKDIATNITTHTHTKFSNKETFKKMPGVYNRKFRNHEIEEFIEEVKDHHEPYSITTITEYYYLIRETAGYINGSYIDGRAAQNNPYKNNNIGIESYIMELGYISNIDDLNNIKNNMDLYIEAIAKGIVENVYSH